jgi:hypothetical protein
MIPLSIVSSTVGCLASCFDLFGGSLDKVRYALHLTLCDPSLRPKIDIVNYAVFCIDKKMEMYMFIMLFYFFRTSKNFRNLYLICFILASCQNFSLEGGGHTKHYLTILVYYSYI